ncbi:hypothetical protein Goarm_010490 [Gossypium armourianum]|uniref:Uncharacterized protein n=1 Tax=Gossypium armourianum TaxID=34283 RepID=A0A7J9ITV8_9ROSI|nr:hypothetical protein [Gossypium armourianum]
MAPKAEKKPAEKKPAEEKKTVAEKAPAEKKPPPRRSQRQAKSFPRKAELRPETRRRRGSRRVLRPTRSTSSRS